MRDKLLIGFALVGAIVFTGVVHTRVDPSTAVDRGELYVPKPATAQVAALGFDAVLADYYWLQAVQAAGGDVVVDRRVGRQLGKLIDVVTTLDPWVEHPYRFAAIWMTEGEANVRKAIELLHRGIEHHPDEWRNYFYLGFDHFYYLGEMEEAADALDHASSLPGSPVYLPRLAARLRSTGADIEVSEVLLRQLVESTDDEAKIAAYQAAIDEIEVEHKARFLDRAREAYQSLAGRDIERVEDLTTGPDRVIEMLPRPVPDALPVSAGNRAAWEIADDGRIVSSFYGKRYEVHYAHTRELQLDPDDPAEVGETAEAETDSGKRADASASSEGDEDV